MESTPRKYQILVSLASGQHSLASLLALPTFSKVARRTLQRDLNELVTSGLLERNGLARAAFYRLSNEAALNLALPTNTLEGYLNSDQRTPVIYDFDRLDQLAAQDLFTPDEREQLTRYDIAFRSKLQKAPPDIIRRERERITIELSWKSSQYEGNTYTLLETETLLKEGLPARGKSREETAMVLNHKRAIDFATHHQDLFTGTLNPQTVVELHRHLAEGLFDPGLREFGVGITGSVYRPLATKFQLKEELTRLCNVISQKDSVHEKALLAFVYLCYLQTFNDGNKRTGRILANAILEAAGSFPLALRAVDVETYKLAILAFYELGTLGNAKQVFMEQAKYAAENYSI